MSMEAWYSMDKILDLIRAIHPAVSIEIQLVCEI